MKPTLPKTTWLVWTSHDVHRHWATGQTGWIWVAHGPHGSDTGVTETAEAAVAKAMSAATVLGDPQTWGKS